MVSTAVIAIENNANLLVIADLITLLAGLVHRALMGLRVLLTDLPFDYQFHCDLHPGPFDSNPEP